MPIAPRQRIFSIVLGCVILIMLALSPASIAQEVESSGTPVSDPEEAPEPAPVVEEEISAPAPPITESVSACADGRLRIQDLANADAHLQDGLSAVQQRAAAWQPDAQLVELRLSCPLLKTGLQWEGTFFSATAQANFSTDTFAIEPAEEAPEDVPYLDVTGVSLQVVHRSLLRAGYADDLELAAASSVTIRRSADQAPFGPPTAPRDTVYVHVAVEELGVVKDVWINAVDGTIYRYDLGG